MVLRTLRARSKNPNIPRILILGLDNAGKTTILKALNQEEAKDQGPTQGFNMKNIVTNGGREAKMCDLGGQRSLREFWQDYYNVTDALMFVVDASDHRRLEEVRNTFAEVVDAMPNIPILIFANKQDLATAKSPEIIAQSMNMIEYKQRAWQIQPCSAATGAGLTEGMEWLMNACPGQPAQQAAAAAQ